MEDFNQMAEKIIEAQELIIGPLAWREAQNVDGLSVSTLHNTVIIGGGEDPKSVIDKLVDQYKHLFGNTSIEVCRQAVTGILRNMPVSDVPTSLRR